MFRSLVAIACSIALAAPAGAAVFFGIVQESQTATIYLKGLVGAAAPKGVYFDHIRMAPYIRSHGNAFRALSQVQQDGEYRSFYIVPQSDAWVTPQSSPEFANDDAGLNAAFDPASVGALNEVTLIGGMNDTEIESVRVGRDNIRDALGGAYGDKLKTMEGRLPEDGLFDRVTGFVKAHPGPVLVNIYGHGAHIPDGRVGVNGNGGGTCPEDDIRGFCSRIQDETGQQVVVVIHTCFSGGIVQ